MTMKSLADTLDHRLVDRSVHVRFSRLEHASANGARHRRVEFILAWTPLDSKRATISAWEEGATGVTRTLIEPREVSWTGLWRGSALHLDATINGERVLGLSIDFAPNAPGDEPEGRLLYVRYAPLDRLGFTPRYCCPPSLELRSTSPETIEVKASRYSA